MDINSDKKVNIKNIEFRKQRKMVVSVVKDYYYFLHQEIISV